MRLTSIRKWDVWSRVQSFQSEFTTRTVGGRPMPGKLAFAVKITFTEAANPPNTKGLLEDELRRFVVGLGLECYLGPFGGITTTYGFIWSEDGDRDLLEDRDRIEAWLRGRSMSSLCKLGDLEDFDTTDINRDVTEGRAFAGWAPSPILRETTTCKSR